MDKSYDTEGIELSEMSTPSIIDVGAGETVASEPSETVASDTVASESVASETVASEPSETVASETVASEPVETVASEPVETAASEPVETVASEPSETVASETVASETVASESVASETVASGPVEAVASGPVEAVASETAETVASETVASETVASETVASEPAETVASETVASETVETVASESVASETVASGPVEAVASGPVEAVASETVEAVASETVETVASETVASESLVPELSQSESLVPEPSETQDITKEATYVDDDDNDSYGTDPEPPPPSPVHICGKMLSKENILRELVQGNISICPLSRKKIGLSSYTLHLGLHYFRHRSHGKSSTDANIKKKKDSTTFTSPYSAVDRKMYWGNPSVATKVTEDIVTREEIRSADLQVGQYFIKIYPGETIICSTLERVATTSNINGLVHQLHQLICAGLTVSASPVTWDVTEQRGVISPITVSITNNSHQRYMLQPYNPICSISFIYTTDEESAEQLPTMKDSIKKWKASMLIS